MKKIFIIITSALLLSCFFISCKDSDLIAENNKWVYSDSVNNSNIRVVHCFAGNTPQLPTATANTGPQVFVYANGLKLNGVALGYGAFWPTPSVYANVPATGNVRLDVVMARLNFNAVPVLPAPIAGDTLLTVNTTLAKGKYYSLYFGDSIGGPYKLQVVEDQLPLPQYQKYKIRLANWNMNPTDTVTVFSNRQQADIITNITHKQISDWVELDLPIVPDTFLIRKKGTTATYLSVNGFVPVGLRMYTMVMRGKNAVTNKTPAVTVLTNR